MKMKNQVAIVTGGGTGSGRATNLMLLNEGRASLSTTRALKPKPAKPYEK